MFTKVNKFLDSLPRPSFGLTGKSNRMARLIDLNRIVDETNTALEEVGGLPYLEYKARIQQVGGVEPTVSAVLTNTLAVSPTYEYSGTGRYTVTEDGLLGTDIGKIEVFFSEGLRITPTSMTNRVFNMTDISIASFDVLNISTGQVFNNAESLDLPGVTNTDIYSDNILSGVITIRVWK